MGWNLPEQVRLQADEIREQQSKRTHLHLHLHLTTLEWFTTMVANEGLEKAEPMNPGPPGPTALHPLRRMRCELFQVKHLQEHTLLIFRVELSQLLGERKSPMAMVGFEPATFRLAVECFNHSATSHPSIRELQLKRTQSRSSSLIGRNRGGAAKADAIGELLKSGTECS